MIPTSRQTSYGWRSIPWMSRFLGKSEQYMRRCCIDGTFKEANMPVYRDRRGRWWVCVPGEGQIVHR